MENIYMVSKSNAQNKSNAQKRLTSMPPIWLSLPL